METKDYIKMRRTELGLSQLDVAKRVGVSEATVSRWESGDIANMGASRIKALAEILQASPLAILGEDPTPAATNKDAELQEYLEELRTSPTQKALFSLTKNATKEDVEAAYNIALAYLKGRGYIPDDDKD